MKRTAFLLLLLLIAANETAYTPGESWDLLSETYTLLTTSTLGSEILMPNNRSQIFRQDECVGKNKPEYFCIESYTNISTTIGFYGYETEIELDHEIESLELGGEGEVTFEIVNPLPTAAEITITHQTNARVERETPLTDGEWSGSLQGYQTKRFAILIAPERAETIYSSLTVEGDITGTSNVTTKATDRLTTTINTPDAISVGAWDEVEIKLAASEDLDTEVIIQTSPNLRITDATVLDEEDGMWIEDFTLNQTKTITLNISILKAVNTTLYIDIYTETSGYEAERRYEILIPYSGYSSLELLTDGTTQIIQETITIQLLNPSTHEIQADVTLEGSGIDYDTQHTFTPGEIKTLSIPTTSNRERNVILTTEFTDSQGRDITTKNVISLKTTAQVTEPEINEEVVEESPTPVLAQENNESNSTIIPREETPQTPNEPTNTEEESAPWTVILIAITFLGGIGLLIMRQATTRKRSSQEKKQIIELLSQYEPRTQYDWKLKQELLAELEEETDKKTQQ